MILTDIEDISSHGRGRHEANRKCEKKIDWWLQKRAIDHRNYLWRIQQSHHPSWDNVFQSGKGKGNWEKRQPGALMLKEMKLPEMESQGNVIGSHLLPQIQWGSRERELSFGKVLTKLLRKCNYLLKSSDFETIL